MEDFANVNILHLTWSYLQRNQISNQELYLTSLIGMLVVTAFLRPNLSHFTHHTFNVLYHPYIKYPQMALGAEFLLHATWLQFSWFNTLSHQLHQKNVVETNCRKLNLTPSVGCRGLSCLLRWTWLSWRSPQVSERLLLEAEASCSYRS